MELLYLSVRHLGTTKAVPDRSCLRLVLVGGNICLNLVELSSLFPNLHNKVCRLDSNVPPINVLPHLANPGYVTELIHFYIVLTIAPFPYRCDDQIQFDNKMGGKDGCLIIGTGMFGRMWVRIPAVTLVSLSKTLNHNCFSPPRG